MVSLASAQELYSASEGVQINCFFPAKMYHHGDREAMSDRQAREELVANAGSQFDPQIVEIFLACLDCD